MLDFYVHLISLSMASKSIGQRLSDIFSDKENQRLWPHKIFISRLKICIYEKNEKINSVHRDFPHALNDFCPGLFH